MIVNKETYALPGAFNLRYKPKLRGEYNDKQGSAPCTAVSIFLDEMVQLTNTVIANSTNISTNIETAVPISLFVVQERTKDHFQIS